MLISFIRRIGGRQSEADTDAGDRRKYARARVRTPVIVEVHGERCSGYVQDVSISGTLLSVGTELQVGDCLNLEIERLAMPIKAKVVRISGEDYGLAFDDPGVGVLFAGWSRGVEISEDPDGNDGR